MKIRNGFVSNSSSSSFILSTPLTKEQIEDGKITFTFEAEIDGDIIEYIITDLKELDEYCKYTYNKTLDFILSEGKDNYMYDYVSRLNKLICDNKNIVICNASNEDSNPISNFLYVIDGEVSKIPFKNALFEECGYGR